MMKEHLTNAMADCKRCKEEKKDKCDREVFLNTFDQIPDYIVTHSDKCLLLYLQSGSTGCYS